MSNVAVTTKPKKLRFLAFFLLNCALPVIGCFLFGYADFGFAIGAIVGFALGEILIQAITPPSTALRRFQIAAKVALPIIFGALFLLSFFLEMQHAVSMMLKRAPQMTGVVEAMYRYQIDHRLWPVELDDLVPRYLAELPQQDLPLPEGWQILWHDYQHYGPYLGTSGPFHLFLHYEFPVNRDHGQTGEWIAEMEGSHIPFQLHQPGPDAVKMDEADELRDMIPELQRRVAKYRDEPSHKAELDRCQKRLAELQK